MSVKKSVLISWSAGIDSTYLIKYYYDLGYDVFGGYVELGNNPNQASQELNAIKKLTPLLEKEYNFRYLGKLTKFEILRHEEINVGLSQPMIWLSALFYNTRYYDKVAIGYVMNDDALGYLDDFRDIWKTMSGLKHKNSTWPELEFPLIKHKKYEIWNELSENIRELCTYCESPVDDEILGWQDCNKCASCKRHKELGL